MSELKRITCPACCGQGRYRDYSYVLPQAGDLPQWKTCWKCDGRGYIDK